MSGRELPNISKGTLERSSSHLLNHSITSGFSQYRQIYFMLSSNLDERERLKRRQPKTRALLNLLLFLFLSFSLSAHSCFGKIWIMIMIKSYLWLQFHLRGLSSISSYLTQGEWEIARQPDGEFFFRIHFFHILHVGYFYRFYLLIFHHVFLVFLFLFSFLASCFFFFFFFTFFFFTFFFFSFRIRFSTSLIYLLFFYISLSYHKILSFCLKERKNFLSFSLYSFLYFFLL